MNTLPWRKPEEKPSPYREGLVMRQVDGVNYEVPFVEIAYTLNELPEGTIGWLYSSDVCADFTRWQSASDAGSVEQGDE